MSRSEFQVIIASLKMAVATFTSRILGLVREQVMANLFGASGVTDAFMVAYRLPNLLRDLFAEGAFSSAFVPIFTEERLKSDESARRLLGSILFLLTLSTVAIAILMAVFAEPLVLLFTDEKFSSDVERLAMTVTLTKIMSPFLALVSMAALFMGVLNSIKVFFVPALAPAAFNVVMILSMIFLPDLLLQREVHPVMSLGLGVTLGGIAQLLIQVPMVFLRGYSPLKPQRFWSLASQKIVARIGVSTVGVAATQINLLITTILATGTQLGAVSWLSYAFRLFQFPVGILSVSISGSTLVHFSEALKSGKREEAIEILRGSYLLSFVTIVPAMIGLWVLSEPVVNLVFEHGRFGATDTVNTALALRFYAIGLPAYGLYKIFSPIFFALDKPKVPVMISVASIVVNIVFCIAFVPKYGFAVLALGTSLSMLFNASIQSVFMAKSLKPGLGFFVNPRVLKVFASGLVMGLVGYYFGRDRFIPDAEFSTRALNFIFVSGLMLISYVVTLLLLGEAKLLQRLKRK